MDYAGGSLYGCGKLSLSNDFRTKLVSRRSEPVTTIAKVAHMLLCHSRMPGLLGP